MASSFFLTVSIIKSKLFSSYVPDADEILIFYNIIDLPWNFLKWKKKKNMKLWNYQRNECYGQWNGRLPIFVDLRLKLRWAVKNFIGTFASILSVLTSSSTLIRLSFSSQELTYLSPLNRNCDGWRQERRRPVKSWIAFKRDFGHEGRPAMSFDDGK